jgi:hypothetical protein
MPQGAVLMAVFMVVVLVPAFAFMPAVLFNEMGLALLLLVYVFSPFLAFPIVLICATRDVFFGTHILCFALAACLSVGSVIARLVAIPGMMMLHVGLGIVFAVSCCRPPAPEISKALLDDDKADVASDVDPSAPPLPCEVCVVVSAEQLDPTTASGIPQLDAFICPISSEIMTDPVITTTSGISYDRSSIERWLTVNPIDPATRTALTHSQLLPNRALRDAIEEFQNV